MGDDIEVRGRAGSPAESRAVTTAAIWVLAALVAALLVVTIVLGLRVAELTDEVRSLPRQAVTSDSWTPGIAKDTEGLCRLVGALASAQGIRISDLFDDGTLDGCERNALDGAAATRP